MRRTAVGRAEAVDGQDVLLSFGNPGPPALEVYHVGSAVVFNHRLPEGVAGELRLLGHAIPSGRVGWLASGDWLYLEGLGRRETLVFAPGEARPVASSVRRRNDTFYRQTRDDQLGWLLDPVRGEAVPWLGAFAGGVDRALGQLPEARARQLSDGFDLQLTVQRELQLQLQAALQPHMAGLARSGEEFEAGVTVMDAQRGGVLAMLTYPTAEELVSSPLEDERSRQRRLLNQNFVRHPIGSAVKPFLFAAVADAYPVLLGMEIAEHAEEARHADLLQCRLPFGYQLLGGHYGRIDFRRALEISCNKYTVELLTLALAAERGALNGGPPIPRDASVAWPPAGRSSGVFLDGWLLSYAPDLGEFLDPPRPFRRGDLKPGETTEAVGVCASLGHLERARFGERFEAWTGASAYRGKAPQDLPVEGRDRLYASYVTSLYDLRPWGPLLGYLLDDGASGDSAWPVRAALQEVSPERVNLALNNVTDLRQDFVSMALGGASSVWTDVQLAEAAARVVTGREVTAQLVQGVLPRPQAGDSPASAASPELPQPPALALRREVRAAVLEGMERVVAGKQGTAKLLTTRLAELRARYPEDVVYLFSKTGSPVLERPVSALTGRALEALVPRYLRLEGGAVVVRVDDYSARLGSRDFDETLARALRKVGVGAGREVLARRLAGLAAGFQRDRRELTFATEAELPANIDGPLYAVGDQLRVNRQHRLFTRRLLPGKGAVYVFVLARVPRSLGAREDQLPTPEQLASPDSRVIAVAIHLTLGPDSHRAVEVAHRLLGEVELLR